MISVELIFTCYDNNKLKRFFAYIWNIESPHEIPVKIRDLKHFYSEEAGIKNLKLISIKKRNQKESKE